MIRVLEKRSSFDREDPITVIQLSILFAAGLLVLLTATSICGCCRRTKKKKSPPRKSMDVNAQLNKTTESKRISTVSTSPPTTQSPPTSSPAAHSDKEPKEVALKEKEIFKTAEISTTADEPPYPSRKRKRSPRRKRPNYWAEWKYHLPYGKHRPILPFSRTVFDGMHNEDNEDIPSWTAPTGSVSVTASVEDRINKSKGGSITMKSRRSLKVKTPATEAITFKNKDTPEVLEKDEETNDE